MKNTHDELNRKLLLLRTLFLSLLLETGLSFNMVNRATKRCSYLQGKVVPSFLSVILRPKILVRTSGLNWCPLSLGASSPLGNSQEVSQEQPLARAFSFSLTMNGELAHNLVTSRSAIKCPTD